MPSFDAIMALDDIESAASELEDDDVNVQDVESAVDDVRNYVDQIDDAKDDAEASIRTLLAFVKTFRHDEFDSIYCEREWRTTCAFSFSFDDVAMIVLPRKMSGNDYFTDFCSNVTASLKLPRTLPIVPWEDLLEH